MVVPRCSIRKYRVYIKLLFLVSCFVIASVGLRDDEDNQRQTEAAESKMPIIDAAKSLFSLPTTSHYWILKVIKSQFQQGWPYSSPPNLDFRRGGAEDEGRDGATEKVKEAVAKSLDKSKATVEDSAKSAAKIAEEAVGNTVKKLKKTLSGKEREKVRDHPVEL